MSHTKTISRALGAAGLLSLAILATPLSAAAQNSTMTPNASNPSPSGSSTVTPSGQTRARRAAGANGVEARIADLHTKLQITPAQEDQWKQVADVMRQNAKDVEAVIKERAGMKNMTAVDNLKSYEKISGAHEDGMKRLIPPFQTLYDSMSDQQKKNADTVFRAQQRRAGTRTKQAS